MSEETPATPTETAQRRKPRTTKSLEYAYPYDEWRQIIKSFYLTTGDVIKMSAKDTVTLIFLPTQLSKEGTKVITDKIYDAEKFTKLLDMRRKFKKSVAAKGLTLNGVCQNKQVALQVRGKQGRVLFDDFTDVKDDGDYPPAGCKWYELNKRGSFVGMDGCYLIDASNLLKLPKVYLPHRDEAAECDNNESDAINE